MGASELLNNFIYGKSIDKSLLVGTTGDSPLGAHELFARDSKVDIVDIFDDGKAINKVVNTGAQEPEVREWLKTPWKQSGSRSRVVFIDAIQDAPDKLPVTEGLLRDIFHSFEVSSRFSDFLVRQHMPGRQVTGSRHSGPIRHELWWSAVLRSGMSGITGLERKNSRDLSRMVAYWQRFALWSDFRAWKDDAAVNGVSTAATYLVFRCPVSLKKDFLESVAGHSGSILLGHPLSVHAFLMEHIVRQTYDFAASFSVQLYTWENKASEMDTPEDYTIRSKAFLALERQMHQITTDHDILTCSVQHLVGETKWFLEHFSDASSFLNGDNMRLIGDQVLQGGALAAQSALNDIFSNLVNEVALIATYMRLYLERSKIGVSECYAMINQRDAETNIQMGAESATIARASHEDNRSLRIIQVMSVIFLPGSLVSSIFGMSFFTSVSQGQSVTFAASNSWWLYFAVTIPLTVVVMLAIGLYVRLERQKKGGPRAGAFSGDMEKASLSLIKSS